MKIYIDLTKQAITKKSDEKVYEGDFYSNVFEVLFYNYENENWFPTMSQLAPNGRSAGDFTADALGVGKSHTYVEDGTTYLRFTFTMGATWVLMKGRSEFYIWFNRIGGSIVQKKCVGRVNVMIDQSTDNYFIADPLFNPAVKTYINACVAEIGDGSPKYFDTAANIALLTEDKGLAVATDTGHLYYWDETKNSKTKYTDSGLVYNDLSAYYTKTQADALLANKADKSTTYTKTESDNRYAQLGANNIFTGDNDFQGESLFDDDINQAYGNFSTQGNVSAEGNVEAHSFTKQGTNLDDIYASKSDTYTKTESDILLNEKANKSNTYTKSEVNTALDAKADKTNTYTKSQVDTALNDAINNLRWELGSHTLDVTTDTDVAFSKSVPSDTIGCQINKVGGMSYKCLNLLNEDVAKIDTWTIKLGTANLQANVTYNLWSEVSFPERERAVLKDNNGNIIAFNNWTFSGDNHFTLNSSYSGLLFLSGTFNTVEPVKFMLNVGSIALPYEPYFEGIRDSAVTSVVSKDSNNTTIDTLRNPTAIQNLTGYGWGINDTCYNYIDYDNKKYIQKVGRVDLGTLSWNYSSQYYSFNTTNLANVIKHEISGGVISNLLCRLYTAVTAVQAYTNQINMGVGSNEEGTVFISNSNYSTAQSFKTAMDGVYLYYELATPVETDISSYLITDTIYVEPLGTLEFTNTYSQDVPSDIDYLIEEVKA